MIKDLKICGISDPETLNFILNHPYPPKFIGFITNYKKSKRYVNYENLKLAYILNLIYLTFGIILFYFSFLKARIKGTLINMGE